jgi:hypothetical protein
MYKCRVVDVHGRKSDKSISSVSYAAFMSCDFGDIIQQDVLAHDSHAYDMKAMRPMHEIMTVGSVRDGSVHGTFCRIGLAVPSFPLHVDISDET